MDDIKTLRQAAGLTQQQLADLAGVNRSQVQKLERGEISLGNITSRTYLALCDALGQPCTLLRSLEDTTRKDEMA